MGPTPAEAPFNNSTKDAASLKSPPRLPGGFVDPLGVVAPDAGRAEQATLHCRDSCLCPGASTATTECAFRSCTCRGVAAKARGVVVPATIVGCANSCAAEAWLNDKDALKLPPLPLMSMSWDLNCRNVAAKLPRLPPGPWPKPSALLSKA